MREREFLDEIATIFGRKNWADFSLDEDRRLKDIFNTLKEEFGE